MAVAPAAPIDDKGGSAFPALSDEQIDILRRFGQERTVDAGDILFRQEDASFVPRRSPQEGRRRDQSGLHPGLAQPCTP
jgi:hypothetical protein